MYLVTGCAGFLGFHMVDFLLKKKIQVIGIDSLNSYYSNGLKKERLKILKKNKLFSFHKINMCNNRKLNELFKKYNFLNILHFAAQPGVIYSFKNPDSYYKNNILATENLVKLIKKKKLTQFIFISSSSVYGNQKKYPIKENAKLIPINYYAKTKIRCEKIIHNNLAKKNANVKIIRPFTVYGPYGRPDMLIIKFLNHYRMKKTINIFNYGNHLRDFTYVGDVVEIIFQLLRKKNKEIKTFNICAADPIKINKILDLFNKILKNKISVNKKPKRKGEMDITFGSNSEIKKFVKIKKFTKIANGLTATIDWYNKFPKKYLFNLYK